MPARTLDDFKRFMAKHTGPTARFLDPQFPHSAEVRLYHCGAADIARYLLNYMGRDRRYTEKARLPLPLLLPPRLLSLPQPVLQVRNCQSFAADFFGFIVGKKGVQPTVQVLRPLYTARPHLFLYDYRLSTTTRTPPRPSSTTP